MAEDPLEENEDNQYTRLKALSEFGYDVDWHVLRTKHVTICGVGGIGSLAAEMLTRCGIGKLSIIDLDKVELVNLNRLCFYKEDIGHPKVEVIARNLHKINNHVQVDSYMVDICSEIFSDTFDMLLKSSDLVLMGLDNIPARQYVNVKCIKNDVPFIDAGASRTGLSGYVHFVIPKKTACYACTGSIDLGENKKRGKPCTASLPTTMAIIASIQVQQALKFFLNLGTIPDYITYNGLTGKFTILKQTRDIHCLICGTPKKELEEVKPVINRDELLKLIKQLDNY